VDGVRSLRSQSAHLLAARRAARTTLASVEHRRAAFNRQQWRNNDDKGYVLQSYKHEFTGLAEEIEETAPPPVARRRKPKTETRSVGRTLAPARSSWATRYLVLEENAIDLE